MKILRNLVLLFGLIALVAACSAAPAAPAAAPAAPAASSGGLDETYPDALVIRNQLALGTLRLEGSANAMSAAQARQLLPLWQVLQKLAADTSSATQEVAAVQNQIVATMQPAQISAIATMRLTNANLQAYYAETGIAEAKTPAPGSTPQSGSFKDLPADQRESARATAQAQGTPVGGGSGTGTSSKTVLMDAVVKLLTERSNQ